MTSSKSKLLSDFIHASKLTFTAIVDIMDVTVKTQNDELLTELINAVFEDNKLKKFRSVVLQRAYDLLRAAPELTGLHEVLRHQISTNLEARAEFRVLVKSANIQILSEYRHGYTRGVIELEDLQTLVSLMSPIIDGIAVLKHSALQDIFKYAEFILNSSNILDSTKKEVDTLFDNEASRHLITELPCPISLQDFKTLLMTKKRNPHVRC